MVNYHLICLVISSSDITCTTPDVNNAVDNTGTCTDQEGNPANSLIYQTKCSFECKTGYERVGSETITCQLDGDWSPSEPSCNRKTLSTALKGTTTILK